MTPNTNEDWLREILGDEDWKYTDKPARIQTQLHEKIKTAYQLARAATGTEEGRKAIDFFYHVHLNSFPGIEHKSTEPIELKTELMSILGANQLEQRHGYNENPKKAIQLKALTELFAAHEATVILQAEINQLSEILLVDVSLLTLQELRQQLIERRRELLALQGKEVK